VDLMRVAWLPNVLRDAGLVVVEMDGWRGRGSELSRIDGIVEHGYGVHPIDPASAARVLRDGRHPNEPDHPKHLPGPLAQLGLDRDGRYWMIADGLANHNGYGQWRNQTLGVEAYGRDTWTVIQIDAWQRGTAAICRYLGYGIDRVKAHRETDPTRKPDPIGLDMDAFRHGVQRHLSTAPGNAGVLTWLS
jgi:hypothetical protein